MIFLTTISKHSGISFSQWPPKTHWCAHRPRMGPGSATCQVKFGLFFFSFSAKKAAHPSQVCCCDPRPQNGEAYFTSAKARRNEGYPWQDQTQQALRCWPTQGSRHVHQHQPPLLGIKSPPHPTGWGPIAYTLASCLGESHGWFSHWTATINSMSNSISTQREKLWTLGKNADSEKILSWHRALQITEAQVAAKSGPEYLLLGYVLASQWIF